MNPTKRNRTWYQIGLALVVSASLIACGGESSSNDDDGDDNASREFETSIGTVTVDRDPNDENVRIVNSPTVTNSRITCSSGNDTFIFGETEVDVCG